ncbi:MAG TPA: exodeoxyribonuclease III [Polyangiaceae bacterium]|nr:exodeoxyribonuclease III [Polyangiaceae bacterium]
MMIASWNVNSIRARSDAVLAWLDRTQCDVLCMQETKVVDADFPRDEFARRGYELAISGQATYNGVAIASKYPLEDVRAGFLGDPDASEKRILSARVRGVRVVTVYVPNGKNIESEAFRYKLAWLERLRMNLTQYLKDDQLLLCGDFNIAREDRDVFDVEKMRGQLHFHPDERRALAHLLDFGLQDSLRKFHSEAGLYTWWDYRVGSFRRNRGLRIDYIFLNHLLAERCIGAGIDMSERSRPRPSDHTPLFVTLAD